ncbi:hypothetical protein F8M41_026046 [Gigaspora margarita]|uniref:Uncharacterized protein n=1 Tax=Gigaspora margarita TaxID=4874 RepID=A0A8H4A9N6_GIGMA|nr:hypothetical protein F8M41_026046 [Gigaspora margarita]
MSFELEDENDMSFEVAADNNKEFFEILQDTLQNFKDITKEIEPFKFCNELSSLDEDNSKTYKDFLNKIYANLMALVTKFKLNYEELSKISKNGKEIFCREQNNRIW